MDGDSRMMKYIHMLIGAGFIAAGIEFIDIHAVFYFVGVVFVAAGLGELLIGE
jgi:hypothetical protein